MDTDARQKEREEKEERDRKTYLNRMRRTLNSRIQDTIYPKWRCHPSLNGWSSMNYPSVLRSRKTLLNQVKPKEVTFDGKFSNLKRPLSSQIGQKKRPISHEFEDRSIRISVEPNYTESLFSKIGRQHTIDLMKEYNDAAKENQRFKGNVKFSAGVLTTYTYEEKKDVLETLNKKSQNVSTLLPISATLGAKVDPLNCRKVKQLDEIEFENDESEEDEDTYEYKVS